MSRLDDWRTFIPVAICLILAGAFRSAWATRLDGFTIDEPWHITAGVAYVRTGEYYLNPEHPPLVKLVAALAAPKAVFQFDQPAELHDKLEERKFVESTVYTRNDADRIHSRVRPVMYLFNGILLLFFALAASRVFGGIVAFGALLFALIDPTVAAHWPVVMTDLPVSVLSITSILLLITALRNWNTRNLFLLACSLGLALSVKHSGVICFGFVALTAFAVLVWQFRCNWRVLLQRIGALVLVLAGALCILWSTYGFRYRESRQASAHFNRTLSQKIADIQSPFWRASLRAAEKAHLLPRSYLWGYADIIRAGMEGRAYTTYAFGHLTFMERRPFLFPGFILVKLPVPLFLLGLAGGILLIGHGVRHSDRLAAVLLLLFSIFVLVILANSSADYAGVRHAMAVYFVLALLAGTALRFVFSLRSLAVRFGILGTVALSLLPALIVLRPWEYHNFLVGGTAGAHRYFRNDSVSLGQRDREIADYYHRKIEPMGQIPYILFSPTLNKYDLKGYRHLRFNALDDPESDEIPPALVSGTILIPSELFAPAMWSDLKALREAQPLDRFGNLFVFHGSFYLPNLRADALFDHAETLLNGPNPDFARIEPLLKEELELRPTDYFGWLLLGNLYVLRRDRASADAAYRKTLSLSPPLLQQPVREQIHNLQSRPIDEVTPMRDPSVE